MIVLYFLCQKKLLYPHNRSVHLNKTRKSGRKLPQGRLEDVEDHYSRKSNCRVYLVSELNVGEEGEKDNERTANKI